MTKQPLSKIIRSCLTGFMRSDYPVFSNVASQGTHGEGCLTLKAQAAIQNKYLLGTIDAEGKQVAVAAIGSTENPKALGVITDEAEAIGDYVNIQIFGAQSGTMIVQAGGAIDAGEYFTSNGDGKAVRIQGLPAGTYYAYGIALKPSAANQLLEFTPCVGIEKIIA